MPSVEVITPPATLPVSVAELKSHMRMIGDDGSQDGLLSGLIQAATQYFENETGRALIQRTVKEYRDEFSIMGDPLYLSMHSVRDVTAIRYAIKGGNVCTPVCLPTEAYCVDIHHVPGRVFSPIWLWPEAANIPNAVEIEYVAGYGDADDVPSDIKLAIKMLAAHFYENPEASTTGTLQEVPLAARSIMTFYTMPRM